MQKPILPNDLEFALDIKFAWQFVEDLGEDPTDIKDDWRWNDLSKRYPNLKPKVEEYIEKCNSNDVCSNNVCSAIYNMVITCETNHEWAKKLLEKCETNREWAKKLCETNREWAKNLLEICETNREWAKKLLEICESIYVFDAIQWMVSKCLSDLEWGEEQIEKKMKKQMEKCKYLEWRNVKEKNVTMIENDIRTNAIHNMVCYCGSSKEWANKLLTENGFLPLTFKSIPPTPHLYQNPPQNLLNRKCYS